MTTLAEDGHETVQVADSNEVFWAILRERPDAVIVPDDTEPVGGEELVSVVRSISSAVVIVAGEGKDTDVARALFLGADTYLRHPLDPSTLRSRVRALLRRRRSTRPADDGDGHSRRNG